MKKIIILLMAAVLHGPSPAATAQVDTAEHTLLHYDASRGVPLIGVKINGNDYTFLFDTGASMSCISDRAVKAESIPSRRTEHYVVGMEGNVPFATIPSITLGGLSINDIEAVVMEAANPGFSALGIDGIIGANVLGSFAVRFDARSKTITLTENISPDDYDWLPMKLWDGLPLLTLRLRGSDEVYDVPAVFDSGSSMGAFGLPSVEGFEQWTGAGIIGDVVEGRGTTTLMVGGRTGMDKLYRGTLTECGIGDGTFPGIPVYTGGMGYLLLCFKLTDLGVLTLDYPNGRFNFAAYDDAHVWDGDRRPVTTAVINGRLIITAVWGPDAMDKLSPGDIITAIDGKPTGNVPAIAPNIDIFLGLIGAKEVTVRNGDGEECTIPATLFLPA